MTEKKSPLQSVQIAIRNAEIRSGRQPGSVQLLAVSKTWPAAALRALALQGQRRFGENYLQEALEKMDALQDLDLEWHFIGPIQSNKTRDIAARFQWAHSIERQKIARRLHAQRPDALPPLNVCIQVNIDAETSKSGVQTDALMALADDIAGLDRLRLRGLMVLPARHESEAAQHDSFRRAHALFSQMAERHPCVDTLSMGMSGDMNAAIAEGSTLVRIGTALFGERRQKA